jgi:outer membrane protein TolC
MLFWLGAAGPRRALLALAAALLLAPGCASFEQGARRRALLDAWQESAPAASDEDVDPFPGSGSLERAALVRAVLERNPTLAAARQAWRAALALHPQVTSLEDPTLGLGVAPRSLDGNSATDKGYRADLSQALPFPGKLALRGEAALAEAEAARHEHDAVRLRLAAMASALFDDHYLAARALEVNEHHHVLLEELERITLARYESGEGSQQDPLEAELAIARLAQEELTLRTAQRITAQQINVLLHRPPDHELPPPPARLALPAEDGDRAARLAAALEASPELRAAAARVRGRESAVALAQREFLPDFTLMGAYDRLWQERELQPYIGVSMNVPLRRARRSAALDEAGAELERAQLERAALEDEVRFGVESGADRLAEARSVLALYEDRLVPAARDRLEAARAAFETGRDDFSGLIDAERELRELELGVEQARAEVSRRFAELEKATGNLPGSH